MVEILRHRITDASAWLGPDMARRDDWVMRPTPAMVAEMRDATLRVAGRGLGFSRADFPLPLTAPWLAEALEHVTDGRGFVLLRGLPTPGMSDAETRALYWGLGLHWGRAVKQNLRGEMLAEITDRGLDVNALNVKPSQTNAEQRPHTDPGDVVALLCINPAQQGGLSRIASLVAIHNAMLERYPEDLPVLYRGFHHDLRGDASAAAPFGCSPVPVPVYRWHQGKLSCVFNASTIKDAQRRMGVTVPPEEMGAIDRMVDLARSEEFRLDMDFQPGDLQLLNNWTVMHWRTSFTDNPALKRLLLRLWLLVDDIRPIHPSMRDGYITGAQTGRTA